MTINSVNETSTGIAKWQTFFLWAALFVYSVARICQVYADNLPSLVIVVLHVGPPALFSMVHGSILYRMRGILIFTAFCLGVGGFCEALVSIPVFLSVTTTSQVSWA